MHTEPPTCRWVPIPVLAILFLKSFHSPLYLSPLYLSPLYLSPLYLSPLYPLYPLRPSSQVKRSDNHLASLHQITIYPPQNRPARNPDKPPLSLPNL
jgi:hypothetical protein